MPLPLFEQPIASTLKVAPGSQDILHRVQGALGLDQNNSIAHTRGWGNKVYVDNPSEMTGPIMAHEVFHKIQQASGAMTPAGTSGSNPDYDYGGALGLERLKSVGQLGLEQQANIPKDYQEDMQRWAKSQVTPQLLQEADDTNKIFARPMRQLANMANPSTTTIDTTPAPPGPPPAALTGMIKPLPEVGGPTLYRSK